MTADESRKAVPDALVAQRLTLRSDVAEAGSAAQALHELSVACSSGDDDRIDHATSAVRGALARYVAATASARTALGARADDEGPGVRSREIGGADQADGRPGPDLEETDLYDGFFRVRRVGAADAADLAVAAAPTVLAFVGDLRAASIVPDDAVFLCRLGERLLRGGDTAPDTFAQVPDDGVLAPSARWRLGHHLFAHASRLGANQLKAAADAIATQDWPGAVTALADATASVRAVTAAMEYASAMTSAQYVAEVRPTMQPPTCDPELTGGMNLDYRAYRSGLERVIEVAGDWPADRLLDVDVNAALAIDEFLSTDLLDLERHIALAHRLVGTAAALHQRQTESAVEDLRSLYLVRTRRYLPWRLRHAAIEAALTGKR